MKMLRLNVTGLGRLLTVVAGLCIGSTQAMADYDKGLTAYEQGNFTEAFTEWTAASETGDPRAHHGLGLLYEAGRGVDQNLSKAVSHFTIAAEAGYARSQRNLGFMYTRGIGVERDPQAGCGWWLLAAVQGMAGAQYGVGMCYELGFGFEQNMDEALFWYRAAARGGSQEAVDKVAQLTGTGNAIAKQEPEKQETEMAVAPAPLEKPRPAPVVEKPSTPAAAKKPAPAPAVKPTVASAPQAGTPASSGAAKVRVWLASVFDESDISPEWRRLTRLYRPHIDGIDMIVVQKEIKQGTVNRMYAGPLASNQATTLCEYVKSIRPNNTCIIQDIK